MEVSSVLASGLHAIGLLPQAMFRAPVVFAYLDAGTGSLLIQWIIAGAVGAAFALRLGWGRITSMFGRKQDSSDDQD